MSAQWIWLDAQRYPARQRTIYNASLNWDEGNYTVAEFIRRYAWDRPIRRAVLTVSADTEFRLYCNDRFVATGPAGSGGDFELPLEPIPAHYSFTVELVPDSSVLDFYARVKMMPVGINEYSLGRGGFFLSAVVELEDGTVHTIGTDADWLCRHHPAYTSRDHFDGRLQPGAYTAAQVVEDIWHSRPAPIPVRTERAIRENVFTVPAGQKVELDYDFDTVVAGFVSVAVRTAGELSLQVTTLEVDRETSNEYFVFAEDTEYIGLQLRSIGRYRVLAENTADTDAEVRLWITETHYPTPTCAAMTTSDEDLDLVMRVCEHSLKYCRQMMHLDSPCHNEPLACTGDYYVEMSMTAMSFGDLRLAEFDVARTADILLHKDGRMFHTSYSLIWVQMLYDAYLYTGHKELLTYCREALVLLLERFHSYLGENGILESPPDYMFVDWLTVDGISLHHPPKALGQTFLNMFYYGALQTAEKVFDALGDAAWAQKCSCRAAALRAGINACLYDPERDLYFEGLNTPSPEHLVKRYWMPQNIEKRYYRCHSNLLAALFGVYEGDCAALLSRTLEDASLGVFQPYFAHFVLEAVRRCGLRETYSLRLLEDWKEPIRSCPKGLPEGFHKQNDYGFDRSHAWAGTPRYALPMALSGLEILEPGYKRIRLNPTLLGLARAKVEIPTPYGNIRIEMEEGEEPIITIPDGIIVEE